MANGDELQANIQPRLFARAEIYRILANVLLDKKPLPPKDWSVVKFDREVNLAEKEYDPNLFSRHRDALTNSIYYLADFASRMPAWINLSTDNQRVDEICGDLADEIEQITYQPEVVINRHGNLRSWLKAILAIQTCFIYREEIARIVAEKEAAKRNQRLMSPPTKSPLPAKSPSAKWQATLAQKIFEKVSSRQNATEQPSLF